MERPAFVDGQRIAANDIAAALTRAPFAYADGATQVFHREGSTTYTESGTPTFGKWGVDDQGQFWSFWPPSYRAAYDVFWIVDADGVVGVRFTDLNRGATSDGRYALAP
jgi:hypothetical protein